MESVPAWPTSVRKGKDWARKWHHLSVSNPYEQDKWLPRLSLGIWPNIKSLSAGLPVQLCRELCKWLTVSFNCSKVSWWMKGYTVWKSITCCAGPTEATKWTLCCILCYQAGYQIGLELSCTLYLIWSWDFFSFYSTCFTVLSSLENQDVNLALLIEGMRWLRD